MNKGDHLVRRTLVSLIGLIFSGIGVGFFLYSNLGVDPASVFELGIANVTGVSYGTSSALINVVILIIVFFIDRSYINIASIIAIFGIGYTADFTRLLIGLIAPAEIVLLLRLIFIAIGLFIMGVGIATYIRADLGVGAIDLISEIISAKSPFQYRYVRIVIDVTFVVVGFFLGGTVGVGTVVAAFLTGPTVQFVRPGVCRIVDSITKRSVENMRGEEKDGKDETDS